MTNFKLTDENGVEWVRLEEDASAPRGARVTRVKGVDDAWYIHPNDLPKPKDRFEEMAEKAISEGLDASIGRIELRTPNGGYWTGLDNPFLTVGSGLNVFRKWFIAHARKIDADATERERKAERERCVELIEELRRKNPTSDLADKNLIIYNALTDCIAELAKLKGKP